MIWLHPAVLLALAAVGAPILIHVLVQRRAARLPFPTLRFLRPTALVSIRRHVLEDPVLLALRIAIVAATVAAAAGPLAVTRARRDAWNRRIVRAVVTAAPRSAPPRIAAPDAGLLEAREFRDAPLRDGVRRAVDWLEQAPPARREIVIAAPLTIGSLSAADIDAVPAAVGIAFERSGGVLPATRTFSYASVGSAGGPLDREVSFSGASTSVRDRPTATASSPATAFPIDVIAPPAAQPFVDAATSAVTAERVWLPPAGHRAEVILAADGETRAQVTASASAIEPWIAAAILRLTRDDTVRDAAMRVEAALAPPFSQPPWTTIARSRGNRPLVAAAQASGRLVVVSSGPPDDLLLPLLLRAVVNAIAVLPDAVPLEIVPIPEAQLQAWSRPATPAQPRLDTIDSDDRRWLWIAAILLLLAETLVRRRRHRAADTSAAEAARVA